jgi:hypothetical protein
MTVDPPAPECHPLLPPPEVPFDPAWRTEAVVALAEGIEAEHHYDRMPILADALEEAGCDLPALLDHCRRCDAHHRGCWAMRAVLGRDPLTRDQEVFRLMRQPLEPSPGTAVLRRALARRTPPPAVPAWSVLALFGLAGGVLWFAFAGRRPPPAADPLLAPRFLDTPPTLDLRGQRERIDRLTPPTGTAPP